jgi:hypothetical protein
MQWLLRDSFSVEHNRWSTSRILFPFIAKTGVHLNPTSEILCLRRLPVQGDLRGLVQWIEGRGSPHNEGMVSWLVTVDEGMVSWRVAADWESEFCVQLCPDECLSKILPLISCLAFHQLMAIFRCKTPVCKNSWSLTYLLVLQFYKTTKMQEWNFISA